MFKKFDPRESISGRTALKSSTQRAVRAKLVAEYTRIEQYLDEILPKKSQLTLIKCQDHISIYTLNDEVMFFQSFDDALFPSIKLAHKFPDVFPKVQVDRGAIKFVLSGANIMCPGLTSKGAQLNEAIETDKVVAVFAEGKEHAVAIGLTKMSTADIKSVNKGIGVDNIHYLGDPLWNTDFQ
ncbi:Translation machinery-associated protein 20 [Neolecta irregularis DAH-3]|uniref:Translation machinery-associated protein 20 n=1 Tax=Neolecta irregularis (strain DAH-3) TaxID=1198029 RepID=A0A1U7LTN9_NEOID|nr:Translation machinery-associated protein 20 [Neolecta irregularis DAH-3]|eukprot:OLL25881.1 Translation machinery-associated protein 20 [Neolecta irregularis DAH-3]